MEAKPEVVVLSARGVENQALQDVLKTQQYDDMPYAFKFVGDAATQFPQDLIQQIPPKALIIFLWDPTHQKTFSIECFKKILREINNQKRKHSMIFCFTGNQAISQKDKLLLEKWIKEFQLAERVAVLENGVGAEETPKLLLEKVFEFCGVKKLEPASLGDGLSVTVQKGFFEDIYKHQKLGRTHSRQKRADFIKANYVPDAQGLFSVDQLMQLFAIYMSTPLGSELSQSIEKALADALMPQEENTEYLANKDSGRSTFRGKGWDRISTRLRELLVQQFLAIYPNQNFDRIMNVLIELQNCVTAQETAWGYKLWGGEEQVKLVGSTIENTMGVMMRMYPCLLKPEITTKDLPTLQIGGLQLPTEVVNIIDRVFVRTNQLSK